MLIGLSSLATSRGNINGAVNSTAIGSLILRFADQTLVEFLFVFPADSILKETVSFD